jgi:TonB family protein
MYFEIDESHPDITPVGSVMSWREGVLLSLLIHAVLVAFIIALPALFPVDLDELRAKQEQAALMARQLEQRDRPRFVFVEPRLDLKTEKPPEKADLSDLDRKAASPDSAPKVENPLPRSRGNTRERVERAEDQRTKGKGPEPEPSAGQQTPVPEPEPPQVAENQLKLPETQSQMQLPAPQPPARQPGAAGRGLSNGGSLGEALRNLQRYVQRDQFDNAQGGGAFGPAIQFDTKGVEFGPWIRRFIAQVKRNWLIPYAAMSMKGHVVVTFNVHKDGTITDLQVVGPSPVGAFNNAAYGALASSNPTASLPPEYPSDKAFFTVTFFYNEEPQ